MPSSESNYLRFSVRPIDGGWAWSVRDPSGREYAAGKARNRALAAALVLREIARLAAPPDAVAEAA